MRPGWTTGVRRRQFAWDQNRRAIPSSIASFLGSLGNEGRPSLPGRFEFGVQFLHAVISLQLNDLIVDDLTGRKRPLDNRFVRRQSDAEFSGRFADGG
jgi:hypothetical protein